MSKLIDLIREHRAGQSGSSNDFLVVHIQSFFNDVRPYARLSGYEGPVLVEQEAVETFEVFEGRVIAAAKAAGDQVVAIILPASRARDWLLATKVQRIDGRFYEKNPSEITDHQMRVVLSGLLDEELDALEAMVCGSPSIGNIGRHRPRARAKPASES
ncbi:MAG: hypothetical protein P4L80_02715 [Xanthobacteraceae bacterium]|nr:hypothetical protein [Xanthobacteraceae bacterium]